ncbi:unnamed protein product [Arabidopsis halleri]
MAIFLCVLWGLLLLTFVSLIFFMTKVRETLNGIFLRVIQVSRSSETYTNSQDCRTDAIIISPSNTDPRYFFISGLFQWL